MVLNYMTINEIADLKASSIPTLESACQHRGKVSDLFYPNQAYLQNPLDEETWKYISSVFPFGQYQ